MTTLALQVPSINIGSAHGVALLVAAALLIPTFLLIYSAERQTLSRWRLLILGSLRLVLVTAGLVMITRPALLLTDHEIRTPVLPILVDASKSMSFPDDRRDPLTANNPRSERQRFNGACAAVKMLTDKLSSTHDLRLFTFVDNLRTVSAGEKTGLADSLRETKPTGEYSNVADAVCGTLENFSDRKLSGIVLLSDGRQTGGRDWNEAITLAKSAHVPVHTVMLGNEFPLCDLRIDELTAPPDVSLGDVLVINVAVTNQVSDNLTIVARLMQGDQEVASKKVTLKRGASRFTLPYLAEKEGEFDFRVTLPVQEGEVDTSNNEAVCHVRVVKHALRTLLIAGLPNLEYHYLVPALMRDPVVDLSCYLQSADIDYIQQGNTNIEDLPRTHKEWEAYDVIILYDPNPNKLTPAQVAGIEHAVMKGRGLLFIAGRNFGLSKLIQLHGAKIRALLPVELEVNAPPDHQNFLDKPMHVQRTAAGRVHPVMICDSRSDWNDKVWQSFPALYWCQQTSGIRPGAISLLEIDAGQANKPRECLVAVQRYEQGVVFYSGTNAFWTWRFPFSSYDYERFWSRAIRYLGESRLAGKQVQVALSVDKRIYAPGEQARIKLDVLDPALFEQLAQSSIYCKVVDASGGEYMLPMQRDKEGRSSYRAEYAPVLTGTTMLRVRQSAPGADTEAKPVFDVSCNFEVVTRSLEDLDTSGDLESLQRLAEQTGGKFYCYRNMQDLENLPRLISADKEVLTRERRSEIWDTPLWLLVMFVLAAAEWTLRKIWGLL